MQCCCTEKKVKAVAVPVYAGSAVNKGVERLKNKTG
jgi:hypothetical protein